MKIETKRQKERTSQHRMRRNRRDEDVVRAWSPKNLNSRAIALRLHAQIMNYNNNNQSTRAGPRPRVTGCDLRLRKAAQQVLY